MKEEIENQEVEDKINSESRIIAVLRTVYPKAYNAKAIQRSCQVYWKKHLWALNRLVEDGKIERIETSKNPVYRLKK